MGGGISVRGAEINALDWDIVGSQFEQQSRYNVQFGTNTLRRGVITPLSLCMVWHWIVLEGWYAIKERNQTKLDLCSRVFEMVPEVPYFIYRHHVTLPARISLSLWLHLSLLYIATSRSSRLHPVSAQSCFEGKFLLIGQHWRVHGRISLMSLSLCFQQCLAYLVCLIYILQRSGRLFNDYKTESSRSVGSESLDIQLSWYSFVLFCRKSSVLYWHNLSARTKWLLLFFFFFTAFQWKIDMTNHIPLSLHIQDFAFVFVFYCK